MHRIDHIEQILAECCILTTFAVIQKYKGNNQNHAPLVVKAQMAVQRTSARKRDKCMRQQKKAKSAYSDTLQSLLFVEEPHDYRYGKHVESAFRKRTHAYNDNRDKNVSDDMIALLYVFQAPDEGK